MAVYLATYHIVSVVKLEAVDEDEAWAMVEALTMPEIIANIVDTEMEDLTRE